MSSILFVVLSYTCHCQQYTVLKVLPWKCKSVFSPPTLCHCQQYTCVRFICNVLIIVDKFGPYLNFLDRNY